KEAPSKLVFHFGMTGSLHYTKTGSEKDKSAQLVFEFADGYELRWLCLRKLGKVYLVEDINQIKLLKQMGPEPSQLPKGDFFGLLEEHSRKGVKAFLLDQRDIAGIGNIYSDEILFRAKVNPRRKIKTLTDKQREKLFREMNHVLEKAAGFLAKGQFPKSWLLPSRRVSWKCPRNKGHELKREIIAGRSAIYCPICQK
ncbi:MAG: DNA-formamidopyrimidine glycosylase family protein, partial [bacterium]